MKTSRQDEIIGKTGSLAMYTAMTEVGGHFILKIPRLTSPTVLCSTEKMRTK
ncbi:hypothetical protein [Desulfosporosinus youngiae]|uniref:Uncharacterized protein n=1 Tax=Desulfosporosinus youngiae DSM 17734 TaxID=768710 RepID=H5Y2J8_9FIRM|nr:hypothetical protein [Desulfosporosinus youngiae]EHQ88689.1 hypothetical protein DesyoDRAFT_1547 [Desulfosporosinus youngiae DSM 17734]